MKLTDFDKMDKLTSLIRQRTLSIFIANCEPLVDFLSKNEKKVNLGCFGD